MPRVNKNAEARNILQDVLNDRKALERKLQGLIRNRLVEPYMLSVVLSRLEFFEDDIRNVIDALE